MISRTRKKRKGISIVTTDADKETKSANIAINTINIDGRANDLNTSIDIADANAIANSQSIGINIADVDRKSNNLGTSIDNRYKQKNKQPKHNNRYRR